MSQPISQGPEKQVAVSVDQFTYELTRYLEAQGLPHDQVLVAVNERQRIISNLPEVIGCIDPVKRSSSIYLSKFVAACGAGLFDAALNFMWDEIVITLRDKVARFDIEYFYDSVVTDPKRRSKLNDAADLNKIEEWELIRGCHLTGILSDIGFKHLDYIRDMRNWASAAHPNQNELTGYQLLGWLETCIKEVVIKEPEGVVIEIKRFLNSIRESKLTDQDAQHIRAGMEFFTSELSTSVLRTLFGMYTSTDVPAQTKLNIKYVAGTAWKLAPLEAKHECGLKYATFASNGEVERKAAANEFLRGVGGLSYLPSDTLALEISDRVNSLLVAHVGYNNFHSEPPHARALDAYIPTTGSVPEAVRKPYIKTVVMARIGNGFGVSDMAVPYYEHMIDMFGEAESREVTFLVCDREFSSRLNLPRCVDGLKDLISKLKPRVTNQVTIQAFDRMLQCTGPQLASLGKDSSYNKLIGI